MRIVQGWRARLESQIEEARRRVARTAIRTLTLPEREALAARYLDPARPDVRGYKSAVGKRNHRPALAAAVTRLRELKNELAVRSRDAHRNTRGEPRRARLDPAVKRERKRARDARYYRANVERVRARNAARYADPGYLEKHRQWRKNRAQAAKQP
jgi:hypothetical protein